MVGCPVPTIDWYARNGNIRKRPPRGARPSLSRSSVEEFAGWWRQASKSTSDVDAPRRSSQSICIP
jgi:hypothetical protein